MSKYRPEVKNSNLPAIPYDTALFLIRDSVAKRKELIFGKLDDSLGNHCALGSFWEDNPGAILNTSLIDEVAAVNDSVPRSHSPQERWKKVNSWLRFKIKSLTAGKIVKG